MSSIVIWPYLVLFPKCDILRLFSYQYPTCISAVLKETRNFAKKIFYRKIKMVGLTVILNDP